jgi:hypothetical protein
MSYPNLEFALKEKRLRHYELARLLKLPATTLTLRMSGRTLFAPHERARAAEWLGLDESWLFEPGQLPKQSPKPVMPAEEK